MARFTLRALAIVVLAGCGSTTAPEKPTEPAVNTVPFTGGVYFVGFWGPQVPEVVGLQRLWPTRATNYYAGFRAEANPYFVFRPSDDQLFYAFEPYGVFVDDSVSEPDSGFPTPPCAPSTTAGGLVGNFELPFGFDGQNRLHYFCDGVRRDGELITGPEPGFFYDRVLADGRMLVHTIDTSTGFAIDNYGAMAPDGHILSALDPGFPPPYELVFDAATVQGNDAFVLVRRLAYDSQMQVSPTEYVAFRLDPQSKWLRMRSIPVSALRDYGGYIRLILSDGTVLTWDNDPSVTAYLPDGTKRVVWRLRDSPRVVGGPGALVVGPREPSGASLLSE